MRADGMSFAQIAGQSRVVQGADTRPRVVGMTMQKKPRPCGVEPDRVRACALCYNGDTATEEIDLTCRLHDFREGMGWVLPPPLAAVFSGRFFSGQVSTSKVRMSKSSLMT